MDSIINWYKANNTNINEEISESTVYPMFPQQFQTDDMRRFARGGNCNGGAEGDSASETSAGTARGSGTGTGMSFSTAVGRKANGVNGRNILTQFPTEIDVYKMGFDQNTPVDWNRVELPEKPELMDLLETRITTYDNPDVLVKIGNYQFKCHMMVLQSYSKFFADQNITRIELPEDQVSKVAFALIYDWMIYKGKNSFSLLTRENILEIFSAAQYLGVKELETQCWALIDGDSAFKEEQAFLLYLEARRIGNTEIMELMVPRVRRFFFTLVASREFVEMSVVEVVVFLSSSYICVHCEMDVFMSGVRWLMHDWPERRRHVAAVMGCVRFGLIPPWCLIDIRRNPANREFLLVTGQPEVARMMDEGLAYAIIQYQHARGTEQYRRATAELKLVEPVGRCYTATTVDDHKSTPLYQDFLNSLARYRAWYLSLMKSKTEGTKEESKQQKKRTDELLHDTKGMILLDTLC